MERLARLHDDVMRVLSVRVEKHEDGPSVQMQKRDDRDRGDRDRGDRDRGDRGGDRPASFGGDRGGGDRGGAERGGERSGFGGTRPDRR
jgi:small subunit ribosomal protein S6